MGAGPVHDTQGRREEQRPIVRAPGDVLPKKAGDYLPYLFGGSSAKTFNWLRKTIGGQLHKVKMDPVHHGGVVDAAQQFVEEEEPRCAQRRFRCHCGYAHHAYNGPA